MASDTIPTRETINAFVGAAHGDFATVKALADQYPSIVTASADWDETALGAASQMANREILTFLLDRGVSLDVFAAAALGMTDRVLEFLDAHPGLAQASGVHGFPILWFPIVGGHRDTVEALLARGAPINAGVGIATPLHAAAGFGRLDLVELLLDRGADPNAKDFQGKSALGSANKVGRTDIADLLRRRGGME